MLRILLNGVKIHDGLVHNVHKLLEDTNTALVNWGILGIVEEVSRTGERLWQVETSIGQVLSMSTTADSVDAFFP